MSGPDIHIRDLTTGLLLAVVDDYETLDTTRDLYEPGDFRLVINRYREAATHLVKGRVLLPDGDALEAYLIEQIEEETDAEGGATETMTVTGRALGCFLEERLCTPPAGQDTDKQISAKAETAMKGLVRRNAGDLVTAAKRRLWPLGVVADRAGGTTISYSARYQPVSDALTEIARTDGGGWEIRKRRDADNWEFDYLVGRDLSTSVFLDTTIDSAQRIHHLDSDMGRKSYALVGGPDAGGADRTFVAVWSRVLGGDVGQVAADEPASWARRELYVEGTDVDPARDGNLDTLLINKGKAAIKSTGNADALEAELYQLGPYRYRRDFDLGDVVTVRNPRWGFTQVQRVVRVRQHRDSEQSEPITTVELGTVWPTLNGLLRKVTRQASSAGGYPPTGAVDPYPSILSGWSASYAALASVTGEAVLDSTGVLSLGTGDDVVTLDAIDPTWRIAVGDATYATAPFRVNKAGALFATGATITGTVTATSGAIGGWTVTSTAISNAGGTVTLRGAGNLAFGATPPTSPTAGTGVFIDSTGVFGLLSNTQLWKLDATSGEMVAKVKTAGSLAFGSTPPTSPTAGSGLYMDATGVYGLAANVQQFYLRSSDGKAVFAAGTAILDENGITVSDLDTQALFGATTRTFPNSGVEIVDQGIGSFHHVTFLQRSNNIDPAVLNLVKSRSTTPGVFSALTTGTGLGGVYMRGDDGTEFDTGGGAFVAALATENWTNTAHGTKLLFQVTPNGSANWAEALTLNHDLTASFASSITTSGALAVTGLTSPNGGITVPAHANTTIPAIVMPNAVVDAASKTTSITDELDVDTVTLTAPLAAGRITVLARITFDTGTTIGDIFLVRLYVAGTVLDEALIKVFESSTEYWDIALMAQSAIAASAGQVLKTTVQRISGSGTISSTTSGGRRRKLMWQIVPGAGTTA